MKILSNSGSQLMRFFVLSAGLIAVAIAISVFTAPTARSVELGIAEGSPLGATGGSVIPASCPSYIHSPGNCTTACYQTTCSTGSDGKTTVCSDTEVSCAGDLCLNLSGNQTSVPQYFSRDSSGNCYLSSCATGYTFTNGACVYTGCPIGYALSGSYCVFTACPTGYDHVGSSCVAHDYCPNIAGTQSSVPSGYVVNSSGNCVVAPTETCSVTPSATTIASGGSSTLTWACSLSSSSSGLNFSTGGAANGSVSVSPSVTTTYSLSCSAGCSANATVTVTNPTLSISANPTRVHSGETSTISWSASQVTSCTVTGPNFSGSGLTGSGSSGAIVARSTYTLTCQSAVGVRTASVTINLIPAGVEI